MSIRKEERERSPLCQNVKEAASRNIKVPALCPQHVQRLSVNQRGAKTAKRVSTFLFPANAYPFNSHLTVIK